MHIRDEMRRGQLDAALHDVDVAFAKYRAGNPELEERFRIQKAHVLLLRGSFTESLQLLKADVPLPLAQSEVAIRRRMVRGLAYTLLQQAGNADTELTAAEGMAQGFGPDLIGDLSQARGTLEMNRKNYDRAGHAFRQAFSIAREHDLPFLEVNAVGSLGNVAMWEEHYDEAIDWFKIALEKSRAIGTLSSTALALGNMGWNYSEIGDFENAESVLKQAEKSSGEAGRLGNRVYWLTVLGDVYYRQRRYADAEQISNRALSIARSMDDKATITNCLNTLSEIALSTGRPQLAQEHVEEALKIERAGLDQFGIAASTAIAGRIAAGKGKFVEAAAIFQKLLADPSIETALKWQAHARLAEVYAASGQPAKAEEEFRLAIGTFQSALDSVQRDEFRLSFLSGAIEFYDSYVSFLVDQHRPLDALRIADLSRAQALEYGLTSNSPANSAENVHRKSVASLLQSRPEEIARRHKATLLFYWLGWTKSHLWVITPQKTSVFTLPPESEIKSQVTAYNESFLLPDDPLESANAHGQKLFDILIQPAQKIISGNSRVVILPDGSLNNLNFETLIVSSPKPHYWIEDVTLTTANSLSLLAHSRTATPPKTPNFLFFGEALFASKDFPVLPDSGKETEVIKKHYAESRRSLFTKGDARPSSYLSAHPERYSLIHFSTHGTASSRQPLESAIILSPEGDSFKLYARDIIQHPLNAYLVTISACNGAGIKVYAGEGLVGLAWAFLHAGAHNVIGGLWEVSNASTPQLIDELYKGLSQGEDPADALRHAKLKFIHSNEYYRGPFYWAPFQLYSGS